MQIKLKAIISVSGFIKKRPRQITNGRVSSKKRTRNLIANFYLWKTKICGDRGTWSKMVQFCGRPLLFIDGPLPCQTNNHFNIWPKSSDDAWLLFKFEELARVGGALSHKTIIGPFSISPTLLETFRIAIKKGMHVQFPLWLKIYGKVQKNTSSLILWQMELWSKDG